MHRPSTVTPIAAPRSVVRHSVARALGVALALLAPAPAAAQDAVDRATLAAFNALVAEVDPLVESDPRAALARYEIALDDGPLQGYGRVHLRLGQIHRDQGHAAAAAWHFRACDRDERVDAFDRELICRKAYDALTAPLRISGLPPTGSIDVIAPERFAGPFPSGGRLPKGDVLLFVRFPGHHPARAALTLERAMTYEAQPGAPIALEDDAPALAPARGGPPRWPAYVGLGVGAVLVGAGVGVGLDSASTLDTIRENQRGGDCVDACRGDLADARTRALLADGLWIGGATLAVGAAIWWLVFDGDG